MFFFAAGWTSKGPPMPDPRTDERLAKVLMVAIRVHAGQVDKQGEPYLLHVLRVVEAVSDEAKVVAALHDVVEDGGPGVDALQAACALSDDEAYALVLLTRPKGQTYADYITDFTVEMYGSLPEELAREVKLADLRDNLGRIPPRPEIGGHEAAWAAQQVMGELWDKRWPSLKARYEKAIETLEAPS